MSIDQDEIRRKRGDRLEVHPGTIPDEGRQELPPPEETSSQARASQRGVVLPEQLPRDDAGAGGADRSRAGAEVSGDGDSSGGATGLSAPAGEREAATTEYAANAEPDETGRGYVEGDDPPAHGRDAPRG